MLRGSGWVLKGEWVGVEEEWVGVEGGWVGVEGGMGGCLKKGLSMKKLAREVEKKISM